MTRTRRRKEDSGSNTFTTQDEARALLEDLHDRAGGGELDEADQLTWDAAQAFLDRSEASQRDLRRLAGGGAVDEPRRASQRDRGGDEIGDCKRSIEQAPASDAIKSGAYSVLEHGRHDAEGREYLRATSDPAYEAAYFRVLGDPQHGHLAFTPEESSAWRRVVESKRVMTVGQDNQGGFAVPFVIDPTWINEGVGSATNLREIARIDQTLGTQKRYLTVPQVDVGYDAELDEVDDDTPGLDEVSVPVFRASAYVQASFEALDDIPSIREQLQALFLDSKTNLEAEKFVNGNGTNEPHGVAQALHDDGGSLLFSGGANDPVNVSDVYAVLESLPPRWRDQAQWVSRLDYLNKLDQLETSNGAVKFPSLSNPQPQLLRRNIYENSQLQSFDQLILGDWKQFVILDRIGGTTELIPHVFGSSANRPVGARGLLFWWRGGADVLVPAAFRVLTSSTS